MILTNIETGNMSYLTLPPTIIDQISEEGFIKLLADKDHADDTEFEYVLAIMGKHVYHIYFDQRDE